MPRTRARRSARTQRTDTSAEPTPSTSNQRDETSSATLSGLAAQLAQLQQMVAASQSHEYPPPAHRCTTPPLPNPDPPVVRIPSPPDLCLPRLFQDGASRLSWTTRRAPFRRHWRSLPGPPRPSGEVSLSPFRSCSQSSPAAALPSRPERPTPPSTSQTTRTASHTTPSADRSTWSARARYRNPELPTFLRGFWPGQRLPPPARPPTLSSRHSSLLIREPSLKRLLPTGQRRG